MSPTKFLTVLGLILAAMLLYSQVLSHLSYHCTETACILRSDVTFTLSGIIKHVGQQQNH